MAGKSWWMLCAVISGIFFNQVAVAQENTRVRWQVGDQPEEWIVHNDIVGFVTEPGIQISEPSGIIRKTELTGAGKNLLVVHFDKSASAGAKADSVESLREKVSKRQLIAVSKPAESGSPFENKLLLVDDQLIITFKDAPTSAYLESLTANYHLELVGNDQNNSLGERVYVFRYKTFTQDDNSATVASRIFDNEKTKVRSVHPNRVNLFEPQSTNDTYIDLAWHVANNGQQVSCSGMQGAHEADAHVTGAWNLGYTGQGIKVGVIDFFGFDYDHPDIQGQMLPGWDCIQNTSYDANNFYFTDATQSHGMAVCGVIGASGDNGIGTAGIAYGAKIVPFLIDGSESSVVLAMQKARNAQFDVDVVNCSFGSYFPSPAIQAEIQNLVNHGRVRYGATLGIVVVTSHGNDNYSDIEHPQYPSAYDEVISVGASTPDDKRKTPGDSWDTGSQWGTNYGALLDISAPGVCIFTTDLSGTGGYSTSDYVAFQKTSASAPIVSGVAALVLSKNPDMTWQEVKSRLYSSSDKANNSSDGGSYNYNYDASKPGKSMEMGYGRVNAEKAVSETTVGIGDVAADETQYQFSVTPLVASMLDVHYAIDESSRNCEMTIIDMSGKPLLNAILPSGYGYMNFDVSALTPGMYFVRCMSGTEVVSNKKFVKVK